MKSTLLNQCLSGDCQSFNDSSIYLQFSCHIRSLWGWRCEDKRCQKFKLTAENNQTANGLTTCRMVCNENDVGTLWPYPSGSVYVSRDLIRIDLNSIKFKTESFKGEPEYWEMAETRFMEMQQKKTSSKRQPSSSENQLTIEVIAESDDMSESKVCYREESNCIIHPDKDFTFSTDESYRLTIAKISGSNSIRALITAINFYGARHGLETLSQLIVYDDIRNEVLIVGSAMIEDEPEFKHRGISLDTSRNFISVDALKRTINGMAMVKLNVFHWHLTDSQSFPLLLKSHPDLAEWGSYSLDKVYEPSDVREIVKYAKARGVQVVPEIDIPGHVGEGWFMKNLTSCYSSLPEQACKGAHPCGQLDPSKHEVYDVLEDIYRELAEYIPSPQLYHMGGDEVFMECWNSSQSLQDWMINRGWGLSTDDFMKLWGYFQDSVVERLDKVYGREIPVVLWTSTLTVEPFLSRYLNKDRYIIQVWTLANSPEIKSLLEAGYRLIMTNYDALYLDCGFGSWVRDGNNWCSPYIGWQKVYDNRMETIAGEFISQIHGAEAALWVEQVDQYSLDARIWPRASALAERLWSSE